MRTDRGNYYDLLESLHGYADGHHGYRYELQTWDAWRALLVALQRHATETTEERAWIASLLRAVSLHAAQLAADLVCIPVDDADRREQRYADGRV